MKGYKHTEEAKRKIGLASIKHHGGKIRVDLTCKMCGVKFKAFPYQKDKRKFCSFSCKIKVPTYFGEKHWNYKDGRSYNCDYRKKFRLEHKERYNLYQLRRGNVAKSNGGSFSIEEWESLKKSCDFYCLACGKKEPEIKLTIDHIVPISKGGSSDIKNIQPLCRSCNSKKKTKIINYAIPNEKVH